MADNRTEALKNKLHIAEKTLLDSERLATAGLFAVTIMHEINNPLEAISNLAYLAELNVDNPAKTREYLTLVEEQLVIVRGIARGTLAFYKEVGVVKNMDLVPITEAALRIHERRIHAKRLKLQKDLPGTVLAYVHGGEMLQVVSNLVTNAVDALSERGKLYVRIRRHHGEVHIIVADNGHGIAEAISKNIYEPFFTTKKSEGTGIGLAFAKMIIEKHRGRIRARSSVREGRNGTAFRVSLPAA
jgi:signal transduction histidine kinase